VTKALKKVLKAAVTSKAITVFRKVKKATNIIYQHIRRSATFVIS
jgi:hypothetical protein